MSKIEPRESYVFTFAKSENGEDLLYRFMLTLSKQLGEKIGEEAVGTRLDRAIGTLDGIDGYSPVGRYTVECTIARTFDPESVIKELEHRLTNDVLSNIIKPSKDIVTP